MLQDLERGKGRLAIKMADAEAFALGRNVALSPGKVVFQNELMQLIQYAPATEQVHRRPLMIMPPWINKFYILDLQPKNSFIKFAVEQGFTVFVLSWVNPDAKLSHKSFEDYMVEGPLAALDAIEQATGEKEVTAVGYCLGGTLLASTLSYMAAKRDNRIKAATFFVTLVDFKDPGDLGVFIDEEQLKSLETSMAKRGYLDGAEMANTFNMLRANDLIWSFVVNNYLPGQGAVAVRPALLERRQHPDAGGHAQLLPAQVLPREQAGRAGRGHLTRRADRPAPAQAAGLLGLDQGGSHRPLAQHLRPRRRSIRGKNASCSPAPATSPASSTRPPPTSTATGTGRGPTCRPTPTSSWPAPSSCPARGGRTGRRGRQAMPAARCRRADRVTAICRFSRMLRALMCGCGRCEAAGRAFAKD